MIPNDSPAAKGFAQSKERLPSLVLALACLLPLLLAACTGSNKGGGGQSGTPALSANVSTQGNFSSGQQNASYTIQVTNTGTGATSGTVTVVDPPTGFTVTAISGTNWTCTLSTTTCTYSNAVAAGQLFPPITVTGNVTSANGTPVSIALSLSGGGTSGTVNSTPTVTVAAPVLSIAKTHSGNFNLGQQGATYTVTVSNGASAGATNGKVTVTETAPSGETLVSMSGTGWTCPGAGGANTCDRSDTLATGASFPAITVTVNVSATATSPQVNQAAVSGGGTTLATSTSDSTTINMPTAPDVGIVKSHTGSFPAGTNGTFNLVVSNAATAGPTTGTITVTDTLDANFTFVSATGSGWTCGAAAQVVTCTNPGPLAPGASASTIGLVVAVSASATGTINNTATVTTAGDSNAANNSSTDSVTISPATACGSFGSESLLNGSYALLLKGFDSAGNPALIGSVLTFNGTDNNGMITAGAIDMNLNSGVQLDLAVTAGSYGVGPDQRGCMVITTSAGTQNYRFALGNISGGVASTGHVIGFDQGGPYVAGILRKQTTSAFSTSQVTGNYVFGVSSVLNAAQGGGKFGAVGVFNFSSGSITGGEVDFNANGVLDASSANTTWPASPLTFSSGGSYTISSSNGRGTASFTLNVSGAPPINMVMYVVSATDVLVLSSDSQTNASGSNIFAGEALQQSGTPFGANPLSGTYVGYDSGLGTTGTGRAEIALLGPMTSGSNALNANWLTNDGGTFSTGPFSWTYSVSSTGRMIINVGGTASKGVLYLVNTSRASFLWGNHSVDSGFFASQSGSPFSNSSASGTYAYGAIDPQNLNGNNGSGVAIFDPATGSISDTGDGNQNGGTLGLGHTQSLTYSIDSTGLGLSPSGCSISVTPATCQTIFYIISPTKAVFINNNPQSTTPKVYLLDQ